MTPRTRTLAAAAAALTMTAALTGCAMTDDAPAPRTASPTAPTGASTDMTEPAPNETAIDELEHEIATRADQSALPAADAAAVAAEPVPPLRELFLGDPPTGTGPQIALRFTQALQAGEHLTAARELYIAGRALLATRDLPFLDQVMTDITSNARLSAAAPCTSAIAINDEVAVVSCGRLRVVVHVLADQYSSGVQISDAHPARDLYTQLHTHAFTRVEL